MSTQYDQEILDKYVQCMEEIKLRTNLITSILKKQMTTGHKYPDTEFICLQFRKILELVALANLLSNNDEYQKKHANFANHYQAKHILRDIEKINPNFYPKPTYQIIDKITGKVIEVKDIKEGFLTKDEFSIVYDECSELMHAENPFSTPKEVDKLYLKFNIWLGRIIKLLNHHIVQLIDIKKQIWCLMKSDKEGKVGAWLFEKVDRP
jgi:hypothetical protein